MAKHILIVEDDITFSLMLKTWLGKKGFTVDTASNIAGQKSNWMQMHTIWSCRTYVYRMKTALFYLPGWMRKSITARSLS